MITKVAVYIKSVSNPCGAVNGRDERSTSAPPLILGGAGCRIASHGGIDFRRGRKSIPYCLGAFTLPGGGRNGSQIETHFDRNFPQNEGSFSGLCRA